MGSFEEASCFTTAMRWAYVRPALPSGWNELAGRMGKTGAVVLEGCILPQLTPGLQLRVHEAHRPYVGDVMIVVGGPHSVAGCDRVYEAHFPAAPDTLPLVSVLRGDSFARILIE